MDGEDSFFSRWSRRKAQARVVAPQEAPTPPPAVEVAAPVPQPEPVAVLAPAPADSQAPPLPTLADVAELTTASDYSRFVAQGVTPEVKNAALKKLFTDPHFNVMDGLDTYIDDYNKPDPLPDSWLRQMVQSQVLGLFDDEDKPPAQATPLNAVPTTTPPATPLIPDPAADENTALQLQPDDDAGCPGPAPGAGEDAGCQH